MRESKFRTMTPIGASTAARPHRDKEAEGINLVRMSVLVIVTLILYGAFHFLARVGPTPSREEAFPSETTPIPTLKLAVTEDVKPVNTTLLPKQKVPSVDMSASASGDSNSMETLKTTKEESSTDSKDPVKEMEDSEISAN